MPVSIIGHNSKIISYLSLMRVERPVGFFLLLWPGLFTLNYVSNGNAEFFEYFRLIIGSFTMRSAGCIINDLADRDFDKAVSRTRNRPIASGLISAKEAIILLFINLLISLLLLLTFSLKGVLLGFITVIPVLFYPFAKRFTYFPQIILGLTFNLGILIVYIDRVGFLDVHAAVIYLGFAIWTFVYDTIYAIQDMDDDVSIGVKSSALYLGRYIPQICELLFTVMIILFSLTGLSKNANIFYFVILFVILLLARKQVSNINFENKILNGDLFRSNNLIGFLLFIASFGF